MPGYVLYPGTLLSRKVGDNFYKLILSIGMLKKNLNPIFIDSIQIVKFIFLFFIILVHFQLCLANNDKSSNPENKEIFDSRKMQLEFLIQQNQPTDSLIFYFLKEAQYFSEHDDFTTALEFLDMALRSMNESKQLAKPPHSNDSIHTNPFDIPPAHLTSFNNA